MSPRRGSSLGIVVVALTLGSLLLFLSLSAGLQQMEWTSQLQLRARARDSAESMIQLAMAKLCKDPTFGINHAAGAVLRSGPPGLADDCQGLVSFETAAAAAEHIPASTNNLAGDASALADGRTIPGHSCHLVALGSCFSQKIQIETVFVQPPFPSGCASSGPVKLKSVRLWGLPTNTVPTLPLLPQPSVPAHVYTNSNLPDGLDLGPGCEVMGNAACVGGIVKDPGAVVHGEMQPNSKVNPVPHYDIGAMFTSIEQYIGQVPYVPGQPVQSYCVMGSSLNVAGDCELQGGVLAVRGDLHVSGQLKGTGFILTTGNVTAGAGASLQADDKLALLSGGNLTLNGANSSTYTFNGLVYAQGNIKAHDLTVVGTLVSDTADNSGKVELERVDVVQTDVSVTGGVANPEPDQANTGQHGSVIHSAVDPRDPRKRIYFGSISYNKTKAGFRVFPSPLREGFTIAYAPPTATITRVASNGTRTVTTVPYTGSELPPFGLNTPDPGNHPQTMMNTEMGRILAQVAGSGNQGLIDDALDKAGHLIWFVSQETGPTAFHLELNNLLPSVDRVRLVTWVESSPTR